ncbi:MAG: hypothetical protein HYY76_19170 [Acidobacteria bacterium]|nr:hypothetical protein [Acidobacteriota bacterium]
MHTRLFRLASCCLLVAAAAAPAQAQAPETHVAEIGLMLWRPSPELTLSADALAGSSINEVDFVEEFNIEDKWFPEFRAVLGRTHKFRMSYVKFSFDEDATIQRTFTFQGRTFTVGAPASTDIEWDLWKIGYEWDFISRERGFFGVVADLKYNKVEASVDSPALRSAAATDTTAPVPTIGVIGRGYVAPMVAITGEFTGLKIGSDDFDVKFTDFDINGTVLFGRHVGAQIGYRSVIADYVVDEDTGDLKMQGPYFGGVVRF